MKVTHHDKVAWILVAIGCYLAWRKATVAALILLILGGFRLVRWWRDPRRSLHAEILADASCHGARIPGDRDVWQSLELIYAKYRKSRAAHPQLAGEYAELLAGFWAEAVTAVTLGDWRRLARRLADAWPTLWSATERPLDAGLRRLQRASRMLDEARREAAGEAR